jgi:hypothetical protein
MAAQKLQPALRTPSHHRSVIQRALINLAKPTGNAKRVRSKDILDTNTKTQDELIAIMKSRPDLANAITDAIFLLEFKSQDEDMDEFAMEIEDMMEEEKAIAEGKLVFIDSAMEMDEMDFKDAVRSLLMLKGGWILLTFLKMVNPARYSALTMHNLQDPDDYSLADLLYEASTAKLYEWLSGLEDSKLLDDYDFVGAYNNSVKWGGAQFSTETIYKWKKS